MAENGASTEHGLPEKIGNVLSIVFLVLLAALFLWGYIPNFL
jgi:hypothetical protein